MTARSRYRVGALAIAVASLVGCLSLLFAPMAAVPIVSASALHIGSIGSADAERPPQAVADARPAVVRVLAKYYGMTRGGELNPVPVSCAGTGVLVGTTGTNSFNYVLTATSLVNPNIPCEGAQAAFQQLYGPAQSWGVDHIEIWLSAAYTGAKASELGSMRYRVDSTQIATNGGPYAPKLLALPLTRSTGAPNHDLPVLQVPQPSDPPAGPDQTVLDLGGGEAQPLGRDSLTDGEVVSSLYPAEVSAAQVGQEVPPTATKPAGQPTAVGGTVVPTHAATAASTQAATTPNAAGASVGVGAPVVDDRGALVSMVIADAAGSHVLATLSQVVDAIGAVSGKPGALMTQWSKGIGAFYATPPDFSGASAAFSALQTADPDFGGVAPFLAAAQSRSTDVAPLGGALSGTATPTPTVQQPSGPSSISLPALLAIVGAILFVLLLAAALLVHRAFEGARNRPRPLRPRPVTFAPAPRRMPTPILYSNAAGTAAGSALAQAESNQAQLAATGRPGSEASRDFALPDPRVEESPTWVMPVAPPVSLSRGRNLVPQAAGLTAVGVKRTGDPNQDNILALTGTRLVDGRPQSYGLFIVADGMGGHTNGQEASRRTIEVVGGHVMTALTGGQPLGPAVLPALLKEGAMKANADLREQNFMKSADMGTTLTAAVVLGDVACVANVGDSRTYVFSPDSGLRQITTDHSVVASLVAAGVIRPEDVFTHPRRNQIYRSLGGQHEDTDVDTFEVALQAGDRLLLCSDGLWEMVRDPQIEAILRSSAEPQQATELLVREANDNGGEDNISVVVVRLLDEHASATVTPGFQVLAAPAEATLPAQG
jgi:serine/threonine protein phosphatase PrpC